MLHGAIDELPIGLGSEVLCTEFWFWSLTLLLAFAFDFACVSAHLLAFRIRPVALVGVGHANAGSGRASVEFMASG